MKKIILALASLLLSVQAWSFQCHTPRHEVAMSFEGGKLVLSSEREPAHEGSQNLDVQVFREGASITQAFVYGGEHHVIHVQDQSQPDSLADYYLRTNDKGQSILYPLHCQGKNALVSLR